MFHEAEIDPRLQKWFEAAMDIPPRSPHKASSTRLQYLALADSLVEKHSSCQNSKPGLSQLSQLSAQLARFKPVLTLQLTQIIVLSLLVVLFISGVGVALAQNALPGQSLYTLKRWSEAAWLGVIPDSANEWQWAIAFAGRRVDEMGTEYWDDLDADLVRLIDRSITAAGMLPPARQRQAFQEIQRQLTRSQETISSLAESTGDPRWLRLYGMLQMRISWLDEALDSENGAIPIDPTPANLSGKSGNIKTITVELPLQRTPTPAPHDFTGTPGARRATRMVASTPSPNQVQTWTTRKPLAGTLAPTKGQGAGGTPMRTSSPKFTNQPGGGPTDPPGGDPTGGSGNGK